MGLNKLARLLYQILLKGIFITFFIMKMIYLANYLDFKIPVTIINKLLAFLHSINYIYAGI